MELLAVCLFPTACSGRIHSVRTDEYPGRQSEVLGLLGRPAVCYRHRLVWGFVHRQGQESRRTCSCAPTGVRRVTDVDGRLSASDRTTVSVSNDRQSRLLPNLYARVLRPEVDGSMVGRVGNAEDVSNIVGRPEGVEVPK